MRALGLTLILAIGAVIGFAQPPASQPSTPVPGFVADSAWPKLPNSWVLGVTSSVAVDQRDHVFILHRPRTVAAGQKAAPPVVEFDADGKSLWEAAVVNPVAATRLPNGHTLVATMVGQRVLELDRNGQEVWQHATDGRPWRARRR